MNILFEGYKYPDTIRISDFLDARFTKDNSTSYVGYFQNVDKGQKDVTFILPKVFLEVDQVGEMKNPFGRNGSKPEDFISGGNINERNGENSQDLMNDGEKEFLFNFSMWIYSAILKYSEFIGKEERAKNEDLQIASSRTDGANEKALIEIALSMREFHRKHSHLLTYITRLNFSGHNNIDWSKTISTQQPIFESGAPIYVEFANRGKVINFDEELIVLFYSVLNYINDKYSLFRVKTPVNYKLYSAQHIQDMIDNETGTRALWAIRRKYFTDELVELWGLVYSFFDHEESISHGQSKEEYLLINKFESVFEAMVDDLLGYEPPQEMNITKKQRDGKRIDHLYTGYSLLTTDENRREGSIVCFIGDSKYYLDPVDIGKNSEAVSKQYTYAKNIIQYSITDYLNKKSKELKYRDDLTEGYTITPNFFLRGEIKFTNDGHLTDYANEPFIEEVDKSKATYEVNRQWADRLFDRDTLMLKAFNINFLYLLSLYISDETPSKRSETREKIFNSIVTGLCEAYDFYIVRPKGNIKDFVDQNFRDFVGTMFQEDENDDFIWFAFEKNTTIAGHDITKVQGSIHWIKKADFADGKWDFKIFP